MATTMATDALKKRFETEGFEVPDDVVAVALADVARERSWSEDDLVKMWDLFDANALAVGEELEMRHVVRSEWIEKFEAFARDAAEAMALTEPAAAGKGLAVTPERGAALLWYNHDPEGAREPAAVHAGARVLSGEKWGANHWVRGA